MSVLTYSGIEGFFARFAALRPHLPGDVAARDRAAAILRVQGLPSIRDEAWKYTNLRPVAQASFQSAATADPSALLARLPQLNAPRLVMVDGHYLATLSTLPPQVKCLPFAAAPKFGTLANPACEPMVALNTMLAEDGFSLTIPANIDAGLIVIAHLTTAARSTHPRHAITLEEGARASLLEIYLGEGAYLHNPVTEIHIGEGANLTHARLQDEAEEGFHLGTIYARIAAHSIYDSFSLNIGARLSRTELHASLAGAHATAHLNAAQILTGVQHADFTTIVSHDAPHGASRQTVKNALAGRSRGVFQGKIHVARGAQKTDGYQMNQALLLSPDAEIDSKPQLEIYADDVKCSHGATIGELDADQLFYLRSRGVPESQARGMLVRAFLSDAIDMVANGASRAVLETAVELWWQRHPA
ncbi:MAG: Fe-S cluster assembly protein SufD [Acetobacteraceae bacterium]|nr:Fe-S cluster assembly protein SufD [Acetobacteraceae bacterium]MSP29558.1 Fe-S cluster assembly protein SufD [Acetobacteraceae bacterium]